MENGVLLFFVDFVCCFFMVTFLFKSLNQSEDSTVNDKVCSLMSLHCPKDNLNLCINTQLVTVGADSI